MTAKGVMGMRHITDNINKTAWKRLDTGIKGEDGEAR